MSSGSSLSQWRLITQLRNFLSKSYPSVANANLQKDILSILQFSENKSSKDSETAASNKSLKESDDTSKESLDESSSGSSTALNIINEKEEKNESDIKKTLNQLNAYLPQLPSFLSLGKGNSLPIGELNSVPKWMKKKKDPSISRSSVDARTRHLIKGLDLGLDCNITRNRVEDLCIHLKKYPETKGVAVKGAGISRLLGIIHQSTDQDTEGAAREALSLIGYSEPVKGHGIRILSIDGGGVRGLVALEILKHLESVTGEPIHKLFDFICGVSTGAIVAVLVGFHRLPLDDCAKLYQDISCQIFSQTTFRGTASLVWKNSFYDSQAWTEILKKNMGESPLIESARRKGYNKLCLVSSLARSSWVKAYLFRNYEFSYRAASRFNGCSSAHIWEAVRASAAAPGYFSEFKLNDLVLMDGGVLMNNPTAIAIHEARQIWPGTPLQSVVSIGTGRHEPLLFEDGGTNWTARLRTIINSATDTEGVHTTLHDLLPGQTYFRVNPYLSEDITLDEIDSKKLASMLEDTALYLRKNEIMIQNAVKSLTKPKSVVDKVLDAVTLQRHLRNI